jgi:Ca2+-binding RTX toxin-like protein
LFRLWVVRVAVALSVALTVGLSSIPSLAFAEEEPIATYSFNEGEGDTAHDSAGSHDGAVKGAFWVKGKYGAALRFFRGKSHVVTVPISSDFEFGEEFTLEAWVRPQAFGYNPILFKEIPEYFSYELLILESESEEEAPSVAGGFVNPGEFSWEGIESSKELSLRAWTHVALTFDSENLRLYLDGELVGIESVSAPESGEGVLEIGGATIFGSYFDGKIDEVRLYDRALNLEEVNEDKATPIEGTEGSEDPEEWESPEGCDAPEIEVEGDVTERGIPGVDLTVEVEPGESPCETEEGKGRPVGFDVYIEGNLVYSDVQSCSWFDSEESPGPCPTAPLKMALQLPYEDVIGTHRYVVRSEDQLGNEAEPVEWTETTPAEGTISSIPPEAEDSKGSKGCETPKNRYSRYVFRGKVVYGTPCADILGTYVGRGTTTYVAGTGDDVIKAGGEIDRIRGGAGNDKIFGGRGNDHIFGGAGEDQVVGGSGDDMIKGEGGGDTLSGASGSDTIFGNDGDDVIDGGGTSDSLFGGSGTNTLSFADAVTPGFEFGEFLGGFPTTTADRGVYVDLSEEAKKDKRKREYVRAFDGFTARFGGGSDKIYLDGGGFQNVVGSPFGDVIVGSDEANVIDGSGGPDILEGGGGDDEVYGGADSDLVDGGEDQSAGNLDGGDGDDICLNGTESAQSCERENTEEGLKPTSAEAIVIGRLDPDDSTYDAGIYVRGSEGPDSITATWDGGHGEEEENVIHLVASGEGRGRFDTSANELSGCTVEAAAATCPLAGVDSISMYGGSGADVLKAHKFPAGVAVTVQGGTDRDILQGGGSSEDVLVDGPGEGKDDLFGFGDDDTFFANEGRDRLYGAAGNDLFVSSWACEDRIFGGDGAWDNASWAQIRGEEKGESGEFEAPTNGAEVLLPQEAGKSGEVTRVGAGCEEDGQIKGVEFLEGSGGNDRLEGNGAHNLILGRSGKDRLIGLGGKDNLLANNRNPEGTTEQEKHDPDETLNCGGDQDILRYDKPYDEPAIDENCETARGGPPAQSSNISGIGADSTAEARTSSIDEDIVGAASDPEAIPPIAFFRLDESSGTSVADWIDEETPGAYSGGVTLGESGAIEESDAVHLDGEDDHLDLSSEWDPAEYSEAPCGGVVIGYSVEMWVKFDAEATGREELFSRSEDGAGLFVYRSADGRLNLSLGYPPDAVTVSSDKPVSIEGWHHVVATLAKTTPGCIGLLAGFGLEAIPEITLYVDGFAYPLGLSGPGYPFPPATPFADNIVGAKEEESGFSNELRATVDDVAIYDVPLGEAAVEEHLVASDAPVPSTILIPPVDPEDGDADEDGVLDSVDNCPETSNADQGDGDGDGIGDACQAEPDADEDGVSDEADNCPEVANEEQIDSDGDGIGDACEEEGE